MSQKLDSRQILSADASLRALARSDLQGGVLEVAGEVDGETVSAMVAMAERQIADATSDLGLGRPCAWHVSLGSSVWYVVHCQEELVVLLGSSSKNPTATLKKVAKTCGA